MTSRPSTGATIVVGFVGALAMLTSSAMATPLETPTFRMFVDVTNDEFANGIDYDWDDSLVGGNPGPGFGNLDVGGYGVYNVGGIVMVGENGDIPFDMRSGDFSGWRYSGSMGGLYVDGKGNPTGGDWTLVPVSETLASGNVELMDKKTVLAYLRELGPLLELGSPTAQRTILKGFIRSAEIAGDDLTIR